MTDRTVLVTGASGYIAKHILLRLLNAGYRVTGSLRSLQRADEVRAALRPGLRDAGALEERLSFVALDLTSDAGWDSALQGADALIHTASPFPMVQPDDDEDLIRPAVDGALRALRAAKAAGVDRVILTSSTAAVVNCDLSDGRDSYTEDDWTDLTHPAATAYVKSKTLAERAAWDFVATRAPGMRLTVINPGLVLGAPLDGNYGTSIRLVERLLRGRDPMLPHFGFPAVDVGDVAEMHLRALTRDGTAGQRFLAVDRFLWVAEMAEILKAAHPERRIVTRRAPDLMVRLLAIFDKPIRSILPILGKRDDASNARARQAMGMDFTNAAESLRAAAAWLIGNRIV